MFSLLNEGNFFTDYGLIIIFVVALALLMFYNFSRRKKEDAYRKELISKIVPGAKVLTRAGLYGTVVSVTETTDGKVVLLESGEGNKVSYHKLHIDAIYGIDNNQTIMYDSEGKVLSPEETEAALKSINETIKTTSTKKPKTKTKVESEEKAAIDELVAIEPSVLEESEAKEVSVVDEENKKTKKSTKKNN